MLDEVIEGVVDGTKHLVWLGVGRQAVGEGADLARRAVLHVVAEPQFRALPDDAARADGGEKRAGLLDDFRQMELQKLITELYGEQGRTERIKNTPLPRQYATSSTLFIIIFIILLPFGMITEFNALGDGGIWLLVPFNIIVSWIFSLMEYIGDYSENPFEGLMNEIGRASCRERVSSPV